MVKNKHRILNGGQKKTVVLGPKEKEARKACQKAMHDFRGVVFAITNQKKVQARISSSIGKGKEGAYPQSGRSASETPSEEGYGHA